MRQIVAVVACVGLLAAGCTSTSDPTSTTNPPAPTSTAEPTTSTSAPDATTTTSGTTTSTTSAVAPPSDRTAFAADLQEIPLITDGIYGGPPWPQSLDSVAFVDEIPASLRDDLLQQGFVIEPNSTTYDFGLEALSWSSQFSSLYEGLSPYGDRPVFVTTDVAYHLWHQVFDFVLRDTEEKQLLPVLERLVTSLLEDASTQAESLAGSGAHDAAVRAKEFLEAVATVLELNVGPIGQKAQDEVELVEEATRQAVSPTVGGSCSPESATASCVDYSLMKPRGHYTRTEDLQRFFKAMSMLGNIGFSATDVDTLRVGLLIAGLIVGDPQRAQDWATIYNPTAWLVGAADDYTPFEAAVAADEVIDGGLSDGASLASDATVAAVGEQLLAMREVRIDPGRASLRTMGARFVLDSWIYDQLTAPSVEGRVRPTPLDLASVFGSAFATQVQSSEGEPTEFPDYGPKIAELEEVVAGRTIEDWGRTVYDGWLYALEPMWAERYQGAYPPFMGSTAWDAKSHNTGFSSYTELKHDTILYAKQGIAEGEAPEPPPPPRHWVEPDPVAFARIAAVATMLRDGLTDARLMLPGDYDVATGEPWVNEAEKTRWVTEKLIDMVDRFARIAADELEGKPISDDDNDWLSHIGGRIANLILVIYPEGAEPSPLVADIFLDPSADEVLEIATGPLDTIHVLVPNDEGQFQVASGSVYSYYEFWGPRGNRLTDEEWWDRIIAGDIPERPSWWLDELG